MRGDPLYRRSMSDIRGINFPHNFCFLLTNCPVYYFPPVVYHPCKAVLGLPAAHRFTFYCNPSLSALIRPVKDFKPLPFREVGVQASHKHAFGCLVKLFLDANDLDPQVLKLIKKHGKMGLFSGQPVIRVNYNRVKLMVSRHLPESSKLFSRPVYFSRPRFTKYPDNNNVLRPSQFFTVFNLAVQPRPHLLLLPSNPCGYYPSDAP